MRTPAVKHLPFTHFPRVHDVSCGMPIYADYTYHSDYSLDVFRSSLVDRVQKWMILELPLSIHQVKEVRLHRNPCYCDGETITVDVYKVMGIRDMSAVRHLMCLSYRTRNAEDGKLNRQPLHLKLD
jgi:hypothetical protein